MHNIGRDQNSADMTLLEAIKAKFIQTLKLMSKHSSVISSSPEIMGGTPVFVGTRVPVQTLLDYLKAGESIDDFLDGFPTVSREQVIALLEEAEKQIVRMVA
ncbi:DUF433 domain-containing protein [Leptolyngbya boryana FACHB-1624]